MIRAGRRACRDVWHQGNFRQGVALFHGRSVVLAHATLRCGNGLRHNAPMAENPCLCRRPRPASRSTSLLAPLLAGLLTLSLWPAQAQDGSKPVYRCPGPPVLYTDALSPQDARDKGCRTIEGAPITIVQAPPRARPAASAASAPRPGDSRVDPAAQRARDTDARRILSDELRREEERLAAMQAEFNGGEPERRGDERNFARYTERVAEMRAAIQRKEADIAAIRREIAKLPS